mgnify:CR=1 FL=1
MKREARLPSSQCLKSTQEQQPRDLTLKHTLLKAHINPKTSTRPQDQGLLLFEAELYTKQWGL